MGDEDPPPRDGDGEGDSAAAISHTYTMQLPGAPTDQGPIDSMKSGGARGRGQRQRQWGIFFSMRLGIDMVYTL